MVNKSRTLIGSHTLPVKCNHWRAAVMTGSALWIFLKGDAIILAFKSC